MTCRDFHFELENKLESNIELSPVSSEETVAFELCGDIIIKPSSERIFPKIILKEEKISITPKQKKTISGQISKIDFQSIGISDQLSFVQRLKIVDKENNSMVGYISFQSSVFRIRPELTIESCKGYEIRKREFKFGGALIHFEVKKANFRPII